MPDDFMIEHYSDGDLVNCDTETGQILAGPQSLAIWGPSVRELITLQPQCVALTRAAAHGFHTATPDRSHQTAVKA